MLSSLAYCRDISLTIAWFADAACSGRSCTTTRVCLQQRDKRPKNNNRRRGCDGVGTFPRLLCADLGGLLEIAPCLVEQDEDSFFTPLAWEGPTQPRIRLWP